MLSGTSNSVGGGCLGSCVGGMALEEEPRGSHLFTTVSHVSALGVRGLYLLAPMPLPGRRSECTACDRAIMQQATSA